MKEDMKRKLGGSIIAIVLSLCLLLYALLTDQVQSKDFLFGVASGMLLVGLVNLAFVIHKNKQKGKKKEEKANPLFTQKVGDVSQRISIFCFSILSLLFALTGDMEGARDFAWVVCFSLIIYMGCYIVISRKK